MKSKPKLVFDCEVYKNYFCVAMRSVETGKTKVYELKDRERIKNALTNFEMIGFNSNNYDLPILLKIIYGTLDTHEKIKAYSDRIINENLKHWHHDIPWHVVDTIDLFETAPGVHISLKLYGGRLHAPKMRDLPIHPSAILTEEQIELIKEYCLNDIDVTYRLYKAIEKQIKLRNEMSKIYETDLRSKSDAQVAEAVFKHELSAVSKPNIKKELTWQYKAPKWMNNAHLVEGIKFGLNSNMVLTMPKELKDKKIEIGNSVYRLGIGGLHSTEKCISHIPNDDEVLRDFDVVSYYPSIILNQGLYPEHLGKEFLKVYRTIVEKRLKAKKEKDMVTANALKISINGSYGKFGSKYSFLFSPTLITQVTITGQLALLMLIAELEANGISVVSANTDGIVVKHKKIKSELTDSIVKDWENITDFVMEETRYDALYSMNVNNYLAIKGGAVKGKGIFAEPGLMKNPQHQICYEAIKQNALYYAPIEHTIRSCKDITKFLTVRTVKGGAVKNDEYVGKVIRWYYSTKTQTEINYMVNGNKVPSSEGGMPLMDLPDEFPKDLDLEWYIAETYKIMENCAYVEQSW